MTHSLDAEVPGPAVENKPSEGSRGTCAVDQEAEQAREREFRAASDNETRELLRQLDSRLAAIERTLRTAPPD